MVVGNEVIALNAGAGAAMAGDAPRDAARPVLMVRAVEGAAAIFVCSGCCTD